MTESCPLVFVVMCLVLLCFVLVYVLENLWLDDILDEDYSVITHAWRKLK